MYTKEDLIQAGLLRFKLAKMLPELSHTINLDKLEKMFSDFYDANGRDKFRKYASVDAECMRRYFNVRS